MSVAGRKHVAPRATATHEQNAPVKPGKLTFDPVHAAFGNAYASTVAAAPASRKPSIQGITVAQERNTPVKPGKLTFDASHAAFGNGYANAVTAAPKRQKLSTQGMTVAQEKNAPVTPGKLTFDASHAVFGKDYEERSMAGPGDGQKTGVAGKSGPTQPESAGQRAGPVSAPPIAPATATIGPDGAMVFDVDPVKDAIVGPARSAGHAVAPGDSAADAMGPVNTGDLAAKSGDLATKTREVMAKPADAQATREIEGAEKETEDKTPADAGNPQFVNGANPAAPTGQGAPEETSPSPGAGTGGGGQGDLAAWHAKASGAIAAAPKPTMGDGAASSITVMSASGRSAATRYRGAGAAKGIDKAVRPPPPTPAPLPEPPPTAVPEADQLIKSASDRALPDQELPVLQSREDPLPIVPGVTADAAHRAPTPPVLDTALAGELDTALARPPAPEPAPEPAPGTASKKPLDAKALKKLSDAKAKQPEVKTASAGEKLVLHDVAPKLSPRPERGTKGIDRQTFQLVLGEMLSNPGPAGAAKDLVDEARTEAYPNRSLDSAYPALGSEWAESIKAELEAQVGQIAAVAGLTEAELVQAKSLRETQLAAMKDGKVADLTKAAADARNATKEGGEEASRDIWAERLAKDEDTLNKAIAANGEADPQVIELRRDMGVRDLTRRAARQDLNYEKAGDRRGRALDASLARMRGAYSTAAKADERAIGALNHKPLYDAQIAASRTPDEAEKAAQAQLEQLAKPIWDWAQLRTGELKTAFEALKTSAAETTKTYRDGIKVALADAKALFNKWADEKIAAQEGWWDGLVREFRQWTKDAQSDSAAWEEARNEQLRDAVVGDLQLVADAEAAARQGLDLQAFVQQRGVDTAQLAVIQTFFKPVGPEGKQQYDSIGAVAAGMRARVRAARKPQIIDRFKAELPKRNESEWRQGSVVAASETPGFDVAAITSKLFHAMDQWGTEEADIYAALGGLTPLQAKIVRDHYHLTYSGRRDGRTLDQDLDYELSGAEKQRADALLAGNQALADAAALYEAMHGGLTGVGTDEATIMRVLRGKTPEQQAAIKAEYARQYDGKDLDAELKEELDDGWGSKHDYDRAVALRGNDVQLADAIGLDAAMHGGLTGAGTEEEEITQIYEQNRAEVEAEAARNGWSTERMNDEIRQRNRLIEQKYEGRYGDPANVEHPTALRAAFKDEMSDSQLDLGNALADGDLTRIDAAKLGVEKESLFYSSDETITGILEAQGKRAKQDVERDANIDLNRRADLAALQGKPWDWKAEREKTRAFIETQTQIRANQYMGALESTFDKKFGTGGMVLMIAFNVSGEDQDRAWDLRKQGGILQPEQELYYACNGVGTDLDKIKEVLKGKSPDQVAAIRKAWVERYGGKPEDFDARIKEEVSGRDAKDVEWLLEGEPQTRAGKLLRAEERKQYEHDNYGFWSDDDTDAARVIVDREYDALKAEMDQIRELGKPKQEGESDEDYAKRQDRKAMAEERFDLNAGYFDVAVEDNRKAVDDFADKAAMIAGIVATVVVIVAVTIATGGTGTAFLAALASAKVAAGAAIAAGAATMATKWAIKGSAYSQNEMALDAVTAAVDAVVSVATAGVGGALLKTAETGGSASKLAAWAAKSRLSSSLAKMAKSERMIARVFAGAVAEGMEGLAQSLPSALAGNLIDERNWAKGDPLSNIVQGTVMQAGMAVALSGGMGALGGIAKHAPEPPRTGDILAKRGKPADRLTAWKAFQVDNPGASFKQFSEQFDADILAKDAKATADKALQRELRGELLSGIPPGQRKQFAGVPIEVLSDTDFERFTRSASGQAVVIFKDGKPLVLLREGADTKSLREEGIHLLQSKDPKLRKAFKRLDESNLARWNQMGLDEQLSLYKTKIDIELDAQIKLIDQLDDELAAATDPALRKALQAQRAAAGDTLGNLSKRLDELADISPAEKLRMARGEIDKPQYLNQEPRLFGKKPRPLPADKPGIIAAQKRYDAAMTEIIGIRNDISDPALKEQFKKLVEKLQDRKSNAFNDIVERMVKEGKDYAEIAASMTDPSDRFDVTLGVKHFAELARNLTGDQIERAKAVYGGLSDLIIGKKFRLGDVDPFLPLLTTVDNPKALLGTVGKVKQLDNFRNQELVNLAQLVEEIGQSPGKLPTFLTDLDDITAKAEKRDLIPRSTNPVDWKAAHTDLKAAVQKMKDNVQSVAAAERLQLLGDELEKSRAFSFKKFKASMLADNPLGDPGNSKLSKVIKELGPAFRPEDVGVLMVWDNVVTRLTTEMGENATPLLAAIKGDLAKGLKKELSQTGYDNFRHALQNATIDHLLRDGTPAQKLSNFRTFMTFFRKDKASDAASIGEYFADLQREIFSNPAHAAMKGDLASAVSKDIPSRKIVGLSDTRMVDGAIEFNAAETINGVTFEKGTYLTEAKAGTSKNAKQARLYDQLLRDEKLQTIGSTPAKGVIIQAENADFARIQAAMLDNEVVQEMVDGKVVSKRGLHRGIVVTYLDDSGQTKIYPRAGSGTLVDDPAKLGKGNKQP